MNPNPVSKRFQCYRNIFTVNPTQHLFDDLVSPEHFDVLQRQENASSGIDHTLPKFHRPFQYSDTTMSLYVFEKLNWKLGRFSDGKSFGVWYGVLEEMTSQYEALYHLLPITKDQFANPENHDDFIVIQRRMILAECHGKHFVDLRRDSKMYSKLISNDYTFCHKIARQAIMKGIDGFLTPSARHKGGTCTPIFNSKTIITDKIIYFFDFIIYKNSTVELRKSEVTRLSVPEGWI